MNCNARRELTLDAGDHIRHLGRSQGRIHDVWRHGGRRVRRVEAAAEARERSLCNLHLARLDEVIAVRVDPAVVDVAVRRARVAVADEPGREAPGVPADAPADQGVPRLVNLVAEPGARRQVVPGERRPVPGEVHARDDQRERDVAHRRAGQRRAPLAIRADAERERQPLARDRVGGVEVQVLDAIGALRLAIQARA